MAIEKVIITDTIGQFADKYNATVDKVVVDGSVPTNGTLALEMFDGSFINIAFPKVPNSITSGLSISNVALNVTVTAGQWVINGANYSKATATNLTLSAPDPVLKRIDVIAATTLNTIVVVQGTASATPGKPSLSSTQLEVGFFIVSSGDTIYNVPGGAGTPSGPAGGSLTGTYPNPTIVPTGATPGTYTYPSVTINSEGRVTAISSLAGPSGTPDLNGLSDVVIASPQNKEGLSFSTGDNLWHNGPVDAARIQGREVLATLPTHGQALAWSSGDNAYKPTTIAGSGVGGAVDSVFGRTGAVVAQSGDYTKSDVGLSNVDNTSDANKPVSTAQQIAIDGKVANSITNGVTNIAPAQDAVFDALAGKQDSLGFTAENAINKKTNLNNSSTEYPASSIVLSEFNALKGIWKTVTITSLAGTLNCNSENNVKAKLVTSGTTNLTITNVEAQSSILLRVVKSSSGDFDINLLGSYTFKNGIGTTIAGFTVYGASGDVLDVPCIVDGTTITVYYQEPLNRYKLISSGVVDWKASLQKLVLTGNIALTHANLTDGCIIIRVKQPASQSYTVTWPASPSAINWGSQGAPTIRAGGGSGITDVITLVYYDGEFSGSYNQ